MNEVRRRTVRSQSTSDAKSVKNNEKLKTLPKYVSKQQCHVVRTSLFSSTSGFDDYRGFLNLSLILLVISNARTFLENLLNYGILVNPLQWIDAVLQNPHSWPNLLLIIGSNVFTFTSFQIQRFVGKNKISADIGAILQTINLIILICVPPIQISQQDSNPIGALLACGVYVVIFLKLWSYSQTNYWYHLEYMKSLKKTLLKRTKSMPSEGLQTIKEETKPLQITYPYNLNYKNFFYFMLAPTLCYEANYPRNPSICTTFLTRRLIEMLLLLQVQLALTQQWIVPVLQHAIPAMKEKNVSRVIERLLRLSVPNHLMWLIFFYFFFHSFLNILGEILRFADREFYRDWWNSESIEYFWKAWNIPVHKWCVRHLYKPLIERRFPKYIAQLTVFALSAFFHEYLVTVPLKRLRFWAFLGMLMQVPLSYATILVSKKFSPTWGNVMVWLSLIIGQPTAIMLYVFDYYASTS